MERAELEAAIRSIDALLANVDPPEAECQAWFEKHLVIFTCLGFEEVIPHPNLLKDDGEKFVPDFMVRDARGLWRVFELKTPTTRVLKPNGRRQDFYAETSQYIQQCREYAQHFDEKANRDRFKKVYGSQIHKGILSTLVAGRSNEIDRRRAHELLADRGSTVKLLTFDDIREQLEFFRAKQFARDEARPGWTFHLVLMLHRATGTRPNFLFDVGHKPKQNRISLYVDKSDRLCLRIRTRKGDEEFVRVPVDGNLLAYDRWSYLTVELGVAQDYTCMTVDVGGVHHSFRRVATLQPRPEFGLVLGSNMKGRAQSNFRCAEYVVLNRTLTFAERSQFLDDVNRHYSHPPAKHTWFQGRQFMRTRKHPRFRYDPPEPGKRANDADLVQPSNAHQPAIVLADSRPSVSDPK